MLNEGGPRRLLIKMRTIRDGQEIDKREQIGIWEASQHLFEHPLGARVADEPFMNEGNFHVSKIEACHDPKVHRGKIPKIAIANRAILPPKLH